MRGASASTLSISARPTPRRRAAGTTPMPPIHPSSPRTARFARPTGSSPSNAPRATGRGRCPTGRPRSRTPPRPRAPERSSPRSRGEQIREQRPVERRRRLEPHAATSARAKSAASNGPQVVEPFADADELHRQPELVRDRDGDAALRRAVELRQRDAGDADRLGEEPRLLHPVLPGRRVDDEQRLVRRALEPRPRSRAAPCASSSIRFVCVCSRPAVSTITTSPPAPTAS